MNWEFIGKFFFAFVCGCAAVGIIYLIIKIVLWKWHVDSKIELQSEINEEVLKSLEDIKNAVNKAISEERSEDE